MKVAKQVIANALLIFTFLVVAQSPAWAQGAEYRLGSGDIVRVVVYGEDDLTTETQLTDMGTLTFPLLGQISVKGLTPTQVRENITEGLLDGYLVDPRVSVMIMQYRSFYINGQVNRPGAFDFQPGLTVRKAVSLAQGFTNKGSGKNIYIISDSDPRQKQRRASLNSSITPGDIITVE